MTATVEAAKQELDTHIANADQAQQEYNKLKSWADLYDSRNFSAKEVAEFGFFLAPQTLRWFAG